LFAQNQREYNVNDFAQSTILIVGGAGFVGSNLVRALLLHNPASILVVDNFLSSERENLPNDSRVTLLQGSIAEEPILRQLGDEFDYVFHLATYHGNQSSMYDPLADHDNNTYTTLRLYNHMKNFKRIRHLVYSSAGCTVAEKTYDEAEATLEDAPVSLYLDSPYQISKIVGELYSNYYFMQHNLPIVKARFQNVYGPGEVLGAGKWRGTPATVWRNVTPTFIYRALKHMALPLENEGKSSRDFIYVEDIVRGLMLCATKGRAGDVYNLASGVETTIYELAMTINELIGNPTPLELKPRRSWDHSGRRFGSTEKSQRELGFEANTNLRDGLARTIAWTQQNLDFIDTCIAKHTEHMAAFA
jgi:UDP-glucose 4-epimerase